MYEKFGQFIDGKWQKSSSGETYEVLNPATEEIIGKASKALDAFPIISSVAGFKTSYVSPLEDFCHLPSIN